MLKSTIKSEANKHNDLNIIIIRTDKSHLYHSNALVDSNNRTFRI